MRKVVIGAKEDLESEKKYLKRTKEEIVVLKETETAFVSDKGIIYPKCAWEIKKEL